MSFGAMYVVFLFVWTREVRMALNECIEFPENPLYTEISISNRDSTSPPYRLMHVYPQGSPNNINRPLTEKEIWNNGAPVLFVPGHGGSYNQIKASAAQALVEARSLHGGSKLNFFTVDTLEVPSGLAAELLWSQAHFINVCIERILQEYKNKHPAAPQVSSLLVLAHSMGGMAVRAAPLLPNFQIGSIGAIVTLNTPHLAHPFGGDGYLEEFYAKVNGFWMSGSSWRNSDATNAVPPLSNIVIASIAGGSRDHVVRGDLTSLYQLTPQGRSIHAWSTSIPGVWIQIDHDAIVWCGQLVAVLSRAMMSMHVGSNNRMIVEPLERLEAFKMALHGGSSNHDNTAIELQPDPSKTYRKRSVAVPQAYSHSFIGSRSSSTTVEAVHNKQDDADQKHHHHHHHHHQQHQLDLSELARGICVPLPDSMSVAQKESLAIVTDVAPFRSVVVSVCNEVCSRGGRTDAHNWRRSKSSCQVLDEFDVVVMPHSRRRHHLHHSYDPLMHFGRERHHHRWSRVTSADLIDEAKYRHSGSIHTIVIDKKKLFNAAGSAASSTTKSVHVHFEHRTPYSKAQWDKLVKDKVIDINRRQQQALASVRSLAIDEIGTFLQWSSKRHYHNVEKNNDEINAQSKSVSETDKDSATHFDDGVDWFLETQWFRNPEDLYLGNHMCDEEKKTSGTSTTSTPPTTNIFSFLWSLFTDDEWQAPAGHPWLIHIGSCGIPYTRFTPQTLQVKRTGCTGHVPARIIHVSEKNDDPTTASSKSSKSSKSSTASSSIATTHFFAPIVHFSLFDLNGKEQESIMTTVPQVSKNTNTDPNGEDGPSYSYSLKGHDYSRPEGTIQLSIVMDPRCSYVMTRTTDWFSTAEQLVLGLLPLWISAYHSTLVFMLCLQLYKFRSEHEIPSIWMTARSKGIYVAAAFVALTTARRWFVLAAKKGGSGGDSQSDLTAAISSTSAISDDTRTLYIDIFLYSTALAMVVVINGVIIKLIVLVRLMREVFRIVICGQGRGSAPGMLERFCPLFCRLTCQRCCASKISVLQSLMESGGIVNGKQAKRLRKRSDSDVMTQDFDLQKALAAGAGRHGQGGQGGQGSKEGRHTSSTTTSMGTAVREYMKIYFAIALLIVQLTIAGGIMIFSPMLILMCGAFILIGNSALSSVEDALENHQGSDFDDDDEIKEVDERSDQQEENYYHKEWRAHRYEPNFNISLCPSCLRNTSPVRLYDHVRQQFFNDRVSYELTCCQMYLSILVARAPSVVVAFLRLNPDYYLPLVFWDTLLVFPFLIHIVLMVQRRETSLSRRWSLVPCVIAFLTSIIGVLLYDRKMHRLPDINIVLSVSLCLLHSGGLWHSMKKKSTMKV